MSIRVRLLVLALLLMVPAAPAGAWTNDHGEITVVESGGLSQETMVAVRQTAALVGARVSVVHAGTLRLMGVTRAGADVQRPPPGFGYPMAVSAVDVPAARPLIGDAIAEHLERGRVVMSELSASLRGAVAGDMLELEGWNGQVLEVEIAAVVSDADIEWSEVLMSLGTAADLGFDRPARVEVWDMADVGVTRLLLQYLVPPGPIRVRGAVPEVDRADRVLPLVLVKQRFGEFSFRPTGSGDDIDIDPAWVESNIVDVEIPPLGSFRCHRGVVPYIRAAIADIQRLRLDWLVDADDFQAAGGCFNPRLMRGGDKGFALSRHAWGIAIDINPSTNPYGGPTRLEPRIGEALRRWGFAWGATWPFPDGMHFEWTHVPNDPAIVACADFALDASDRSGLAWEVYPREGRCAAT